MLTPNARVDYSCLIDAILLTCSNVMKKTNCHGPSRVYAGKNPLYSARMPSDLTVLMAQSKGPAH